MKRSNLLPDLRACRRRQMDLRQSSQALSAQHVPACRRLAGVAGVDQEQLALE